MAQVSSPRHHDWLGVNVTFAGSPKVRINVSWSYGGDKFAVEPADAALAERFSLVVTQARARLGSPGYPFANLGDLADAMTEVGQRSKSPAEYVDGLKEALQVTGERPKPRAAASAPAATKVTVQRGRGLKLAILFPTGEQADLSINAKSVGLRLEPSIPTLDDAVLKFIFGLKNLGVMSDEQIAAMVRAAAEGAVDLDGWFVAMRAAVTSAA